ncbi:MAG: phenylacetate--CoA ligase family protein [Terriglobales bacterium]
MPERWNAWNRLYAAAVLPAFDAGYRGLGRRMAAFRHWELMPAARVGALHLEALRRLLVHADRTCTFYHERFAAAGFQPARLQDAGELERIPPLTRADLQQQGAAIRSRAYAPSVLLAAASGGTTDTPVALWRDAESVRARHALQEMLQGWAGWRPGDKVFHLWGAQADYAAHPSWRWRLYDRYVQQQIWAPTSRLTPEVFEQHRAALNCFRPRIVHAYPTPLALWAEYLLAAGGRLHRPHAIVVTAEALLSGQRRVIERAFGCPIFEMYGSREFGIIAAQCCPHGALHLHPAAAHVELRAVAGNPGGVKEMLVTDLLGYGMPLIRYQINDCVATEASACGCGRPFPVLPAVAGRTADVFRLPGGVLVPGVSLTNRVVKTAPGLRQTQIIQESERQFRLRYVPGASFREHDLLPLQHKLREFLGEGIAWEFEAVASIPRSASGKTQFCICRVAGGGPRPPAVA